MTKGLSYRFWLDFLNLRMGDFILSETTENPISGILEKNLAGLRCGRHRREGLFMDHLPMLPIFVGITLCFVARPPPVELSEQQCEGKYILHKWSVVIITFSFGLSFFGFILALECFEHGLARHLHMAMGYQRISPKPPSMLYVSDGGVQDCTGVTQLLRRRCKRILLILAAEDPDDNLTCLRDMIRLAKSMKLGSFYDPMDPRRDIAVTLDEFQHSKNRRQLRIGICYGRELNAARRVEPRQIAFMWVVKSRLPPDMEDMEVEPPLSEVEICGSSGAAVAHGRLAGTRLNKLAGCCCDVCHTRECFPCCSKFPHVRNANQCLTPELFSSLSRLGYRLSRGAVEEIAQLGDPAQRWEGWLGEVSEAP